MDPETLKNNRFNFYYFMPRNYILKINQHNNSGFNSGFSGQHYTSFGGFGSGFGGYGFGQTEVNPDDNIAEKDLNKLEHISLFRLILERNLESLI
eukprot:CAMPEP_0116952416 /NCGR_PEP_ID=MMETSP0467-20121206/40725_1 /TAXON_ID=283647 /ORGANISM="Mesodinium pulex, Strain SPMC105" /LENGTH=94 /DNA_ID=CAMNT_0004637695 /DNA_START=1403 /DNA_END=1687 /DNA_ORIENTATION=-